MTEKTFQFYFCAKLVCFDFEEVEFQDPQFVAYKDFIINILPICFNFCPKATFYVLSRLEFVL